MMNDIETARHTFEKHYKTCTLCGNTPLAADWQPTYDIWHDLCWAGSALMRKIIYQRMLSGYSTEGKAVADLIANAYLEMKPHDK